MNKMFVVLFTTSLGFIVALTSEKPTKPSPYQEISLSQMLNESNAKVSSLNMPYLGDYSNNSNLASEVVLVSGEPKVLISTVYEDKLVDLKLGDSVKVMQSFNELSKSYKKKTKFVYNRIQFNDYSTAQLD